MHVSSPLVCSVECLVRTSWPRCTVGTASFVTWLPISAAITVSISKLGSYTVQNIMQRIDTHVHNYTCTHVHNSTHAHTRTHTHNSNISNTVSC